MLYRILMIAAIAATLFIAGCPAKETSTTTTTTPGDGTSSTTTTDSTSGGE